MSLLVKAARSRTMGDPGLFDFLKTAGRAVLGGVSGLLSGGPLGAIKGAVTPFIPPRSVVPGASTSPVLLPAVPLSGQSALPGVGTQGGRRTGVEIDFPRLPFGMGGGGIAIGTETGGMVQPGQQTGTQMCRLPSGGVVMRPTHANKSGYFLKSGQFVPPGSKCVTNRRMNPLNPLGFLGSGPSDGPLGGDPPLGWVARP